MRMYLDSVGVFGFSIDRAGLQPCLLCREGVLRAPRRDVIIRDAWTACSSTQRHALHNMADAGSNRGRAV